MPPSRATVEAIPREVVVCQTDDGREPFTEWLERLTPKVQAIVMNRIDRVEGGNLGDVESVGSGVHELKIDFGPGYRVYFGVSGIEVHLISGGNKSSQHGDIQSAISFWRSHD